jgi:hypothetical protein
MKGRKYLAMIMEYLLFSKQDAEYCAEFKEVRVSGLQEITISPSKG